MSSLVVEETLRCFFTELEHPIGLAFSLISFYFIRSLMRDLREVWHLIISYKWLTVKGCFFKRFPLPFWQLYLMIRPIDPVYS